MRPAWSIEWVVGQPGLHRETLFQKQNKSSVYGVHVAVYEALLQFHSQHCIISQPYPRPFRRWQEEHKFGHSQQDECQAGGDLAVGPMAASGNAPIHTDCGAGSWSPPQVFDRLTAVSGL